MNKLYTTSFFVLAIVIFFPRGTFAQSTFARTQDSTSISPQMQGMLNRYKSNDRRKNVSPIKISDIGQVLINTNGVLPVQLPSGQMLHFIFDKAHHSNEEVIWHGILERPSSNEGKIMLVQENGLTTGSIEIGNRYFEIKSLNKAEGIIFEIERSTKSLCAVDERSLASHAPSSKVSKLEKAN